jgi:hypothetical protein
MKMATNYIKPEDVSAEDTQEVIEFLNIAQSTKEIADAVKKRGERGISFSVAGHILDRRNELGGFTDLQQVANIPQVGPERFTNIINSLRVKQIGLTSGKILFAFDRCDNAAWHLPDGATLGTIADSSVLLLQPDPEATLRVNMTENWEVSFAFIPGPSTRLNPSRILFRAEGEALALTITQETIALHLIKGSEEMLMAEDEHFMMPQRLYSLRFIKAANCVRVLINEQPFLYVEEVPPFVPNELTLSNQAQPARTRGRKRDPHFERAVGFSDITFLKYNEEEAAQLVTGWKALDRLVWQPPGGIELSHPSQAPVAKAYQFIPLLIEKYDQLHGYVINGQKRIRKFVDGTINPGPVPPNFVHTWAFNCKNIEEFRPHFREVLLDGDDVIKFYTRWSFTQQDVQGNDIFPVPIGYWRVKDVKAHWRVNLTGQDEDVEYNWGKSVLSYTRLYIQLETSEKKMERRFVIDGFELVSPKKGTEECYLVGDDIRYESSKGQIAEASKIQGTINVAKKDAQGKIIGYEKLKIYQDVPLSPWWVGQNPLNLPKPEDGWYLLNEYLKDDQQGYFAITYYNEFKGRLRIYLYDHALSQQYTGFNVRVSLLGQFQKGGQYKELKGAVFPVHINPFLWSSAVMPLQTLDDINNPPTGNLWSANKWGAIEVPFLIPMVEEMAAGAPHPHAGKKSPVGKAYYHSVYDEKIKLGMRSMKLKIEVCPFDQGTITGDWTGKAAGEAIQKMKDAGDDPVTVIKDWLETGKSIADGAKKGWDGFVDWYTQQEDPNNKGKPKNTSANGGINAFKTTAKIVSTGLSIFSGGLGAAGSLLDLAADLFSFGPKPQPLELSLKLSMEGTLKGTQLVQFTPRKIEFYLPGRFAIDEVIHNDELSVLDFAAIDSSLPRYDRRLGLFGYMYNPAEVTFRMIRLRLYALTPNWASAPPGYVYYAYIYPTTFNKTPKYANLKPSQGTVPAEYSDTVNYTLPIIYNQYAEITPAKPIPVGTPKVELYKTTDFKQTPDPLVYGQLEDKWWKRKYWTYDVSWPTHIQNPEPGDLLPSTPATVKEAFFMRVTVYGNKEFDDASTIYWFEWVTPMGHMLQVVPKSNLVPQLFHSFNQITNVEHSHHIIETGQPYVYYDIPQWYGSNDDKAKYAPNHAAWPIFHVMFSYDQPYFYYGRTRKKDNGTIPKSYQVAEFRAPVTMEIKERYADQGKVKWKTFSCHSDIGSEPI